ncbi:MAG TPA: AAA family ATPase [Mycobacterium sp.]
MSTPEPLSAEEFEARLLRRLESKRSQSAEPDEQRLAYRKAAALLTSFDPKTLRLPGRKTDGAAVLTLVDDCISWIAEPTPQWALRPDARDAALRSFAGPSEALAYLTANEDAFDADGTGRVAADFLEGRSADLNTMTAQRLLRAHDAIDWLSRVPGISGLPTESEVNRLVERRLLMEPLELLLKGGFEGRADELDRLRTHVGLRPAGTWWGRAKDAGRQVAERVGPTRTGLPLVVHGPGGIGKSTLVARFLLDHVQISDKFPFAYVDFERVTVSLHEPMTLLAEVARQLAVQYPDHAERFVGLVNEFRALARRQRSDRDGIDELAELPTTRGSLSRERQTRFHRKAKAQDRDAAKKLIEALRRTGTDRPFVLVLDSFEEAQYRASPVLDRLWHILQAVLQVWPNTRVVIAGRAPIDHPDVAAVDIPALHLRELDRAASVHFLVSRDVPESTARMLVKRWGGNPLSLQLAADVHARMQAELGSDNWVSTVPTKGRFYRQVDDSVIQGMLYDRLLRHLQSPEVRAIARPGLVLRRITPELIQHVVAPLSGLAEISSEHARELCRELSRRVDLVEEIAPDVLRHRADVRRAALRLLEKDPASNFREVERAAVEHYHRSDDPAERAEEIYHRLRLGDDFRLVESRWQPSAAKLLVGADREMNHRSGRFLRQLLASAELDDANTQVDGERETAREVADLLAQDFVEQALSLMARREGWTTCSPLHPLYADTLLRLGRVSEARAAVIEALDQPGMDGCGETYLELLLLSARIAAVGGDVAGADADLQVAESVATDADRELDALGALLQRAQLHNSADSPEVTTVDTALARRVSTVPEDALSRRPALLRAIAAEVGDADPSVLIQALDLVGLPDNADRTLVSLAHGIVDAAQDNPVVTSILQRIDEKAVELLRSPTTAAVVLLLEKAVTFGILAAVVKDVLTSADDTEVLRSSVAEAMAVDNPQFAINGPPADIDAAMPPPTAFAASALSIDVTKPINRLGHGS